MIRTYLIAVLAALVDLCGAFVLLALFLIAMGWFRHAHAYVPTCESESMLLVQVGDGKPREILGSVLYYDTLSDPNALVLNTQVESPLPFRLEQFRIRYEYIIQQEWDQHYNCSLYLKYDADGVSRDGFEAAL